MIPFIHNLYAIENENLYTVNKKQIEGFLEITEVEASNRETREIPVQNGGK